LLWQDYLILCMLLMGFWFYRKFKNRKSSSQKSSRHSSLTKKEETALQFLQARGYRLQEKRPGITLQVKWDGKEKTVDHFSGFTVEKSGKVSLVKLKKENSSPLSSGAYRNELLLDYLLFQPAEILLYDSEKKTFKELDFSIGGSRSSERLILKMVLVALIVVGIGFLAGLLLEGVLY